MATIYGDGKHDNGVVAKPKRKYTRRKDVGIYKPCINPLFVDLSVKQMLPFLHLCYFSEEDIENFEKETDMNLINAVKKYKNLYVN